MQAACVIRVDCNILRQLSCAASVVRFDRSIFHERSRAAGIVAVWLDRDAEIRSDAACKVWAALDWLGRFGLRLKLLLIHGQPPVDLEVGLRSCSLLGLLEFEAFVTSLMLYHVSARLSIFLGLVY